MPWTAKVTLPARGLAGRARRLHVRLRSGFGFRARSPARDPVTPPAQGSRGAAAAGALQPVPPREGAPARLPAPGGRLLPRRGAGMSAVIHGSAQRSPRRAPPP